GRGHIGPPRGAPTLHKWFAERNRRNGTQAHRVLERLKLKRERRRVMLGATAIVARMKRSAIRGIRRARIALRFIRPTHRVSYTHVNRRLLHVARFPGQVPVPQSVSEEAALEGAEAAQLPTAALVEPCGGLLHGREPGHGLNFSCRVLWQSAKLI